MDMFDTIGKNAKRAAVQLAQSDAALRIKALHAIADALVKDAGKLLDANRADTESARTSGMTSALLDRLTLTPERIMAMASGVNEVAALDDPLFRELGSFTRPNGLKIKKVSVPLGVIGVIYEARPNVTADSAALCLMSGNACILRGGSEAFNSNSAIVALIRSAIASCGLDENAVQLIMDTSRESASRLMQLTDYVDVLIPRGGRGLIQAVVQNASVPVLETGAGVCHAYVHSAADVEMAASIIHNGKVSRPSVCNALECMLIHEDIAQAALPPIAAKLTASGVTIHGDEATLRLVEEAVPATEADYGCEYGSLDIACKVVKDMDAALEHIRSYGTGHSECIITSDCAAAARFLSFVDAAAVYHNASTRFTDGNEFGMGAEIGISTQKLHARGPLGLNELTSMKYVIEGSGHIR